MGSSYSIDNLRYLMRRLRDPRDGCPWDRQQSFDTIIKYSIEEIYELADAIQRCDSQQIKDELGDVLFQVIFFSQIAEEEGRFDLDDVVENLANKLLRRHPHVFPNGELKARFEYQQSDVGAVKSSWESIKAQERQEKTLTGILDDIPLALPALTRAEKLQKRAAQIGFDWADVNPIFAKLDEEAAELRDAIHTASAEHIEEELGDLLFVCANLARHLHIDSETALRKANSKFERRFHYIEEQLRAQGSSPKEAPLTVMDLLWDEAKKAEKPSPTE